MQEMTRDPFRSTRNDLIYMLVPMKSLTTYMKSEKWATSNLEFWDAFSLKSSEPVERLYLEIRKSVYWSASFWIENTADISITKIMKYTEIIWGQKRKYNYAKRTEV
jgi:hypothetical protein